MTDVTEINLKEEREKFFQENGCFPEEFIAEWDLQDGSHPCKEGYSQSQMAYTLFHAKFLEVK